jgi:hypothetical protein
MTKTNSIILVLCCCCLLACKPNSNPTSANAGGVIIPLAPYNTWIYEVTKTDSTGRILSSSEIASAVSDSAENINGETWYSFDANFPTGAIPYNIFLYANKSDGFHAYERSYERSILYFPYPASVGYDFTVFSDTSVDHSTIFLFKMKVVSVSEQVVTKKGAFLCYHYVLYTDEYLKGQHLIIPGAEVWCAPNIGIIKEVDPNAGYNGGQAISTSLLIDFSLH